MPTVTFNPSSCTEDTSVGFGTNPAWANPGFGITDDSSYATQGVDGSSTEATYYLKATGANPVPSPPGGYETTIDGIKVFIKGYSEDGGLTTGAASTYSVRLVSGGTIMGTDIGSSSPVTLTKGSSDITQHLGGTSEKWGLSQAQLLAVNGIVVSFECTSIKNALIKVNNIYAEITYTESLIPDGWLKTVKRRSSFMKFMEDD